MATLSSPSLAKLISNVRNLLNQPNAANSFWTDLELTEYINEGIRMYFVEVTHNNEGVFTTSTPLNIVNGVETVALPSDCFEVRALYKKLSTTYEKLSYRNDVSGYSTQGGTSSEAYFPFYYFRGNSLVLRDTPNFSETAGLLLEYIQFPDTLVNGGDSLTAQISPIFKQLIEAYAVYMAKLKESMVSGVVVHVIPQQRLEGIYTLFKEAIQNRSKDPQFVVPFNPEGVV